MWVWHNFEYSLGRFCMFLCIFFYILQGWGQVKYLYLVLGTWCKLSCTWYLIVLGLLKFKSNWYLLVLDDQSTWYLSKYSSTFVKSTNIQSSICEIVLVWSSCVVTTPKQKAFTETGRLGYIYFLRNDLLLFLLQTEKSSENFFMSLKSLRGWSRSMVWHLVWWVDMPWTLHLKRPCQQFTTEHHKQKWFIMGVLTARVSGCQQSRLGCLLDLQVQHWDLMTQYSDKILAITGSGGDLSPVWYKPL